MNCLFCYQTIDLQGADYHESCCRKMFGQAVLPELPYSEQDLEPLALEVIRSQTSVTGVQPKLSLHIGKSEKDKTARKFTIVGLWGDFILKPPSSWYPQMPETEDLTMHMASIAKIKVVPHSLIRLKSGNLAYITKRVDRTKKGKLHMEDMCQLTERLTEDKYHGSYEQVAKAIRKYSATPGLDLVNFFETVLFSFLTGNADMHLKNFSLIRIPETGNILSPAYDLISTALVNPADDEDLALTLNGKKKKIKRSDFIKAFQSLNLEEKQQDNIFKKMLNSLRAWMELIEMSFLSEDMKLKYMDIIRERVTRIVN